MEQKLGRELRERAGGVKLGFCEVPFSGGKNCGSRLAGAGQAAPWSLRDN